LADLIVDAPVQERLTRLIKEHRHIAKIRAHGLAPRRKLLLVGLPGTGKTLSASVIAGELGLPLFVVRLDSLITKFMGETAAKLRMVFDSIAQVRGVYLFDEFDSIGAQRGMSNEVGEIRRVLNSFLQFIEHDESDSLILAATNHPGILDYALFRRFDDVIEYKLPEREFIIKALKSKVASVKRTRIDWEALADLANGMSYADVARSCEEAIKAVIIDDRPELTQQDLIDTLSQRKSIQNK
jgi:SpoVK/Ycf46/Vps4 family AAA+-type ATPase